MTIDAWVQAGASPHAVALLRESHRSSWFSIDGVEKLSVFISGTLAGTSLADIIFIVTLARVIGEVDKELERRGLLQYVDSWDAAEYFGHE